MYLQQTTNLTNALQSIATLNTSERDLLLAVLGTAQQQPSTKQPTTKQVKIQLRINSIVKSHNTGGYKKNQQRLKNLNKTQKIGNYFPKATSSNLS